MHACLESNQVALQNNTLILDSHSIFVCNLIVNYKDYDYGWNEEFLWTRLKHEREIYKD